ncbi:hypothetical protein F4803DRAFT_355213 [Xylaria telfairii]|nr:hypothetical protein F4803DRAFT_355213 [Xylaria telfairii]
MRTPNSLVTFFWISTWTSSPWLWLWLLDPLTVNHPLTVDRAVVSAQNIPHPKATSTACDSHLIQDPFLSHLEGNIVITITIFISIGT